ncbi:MAG: dephospho-CoA kinase [Alphaproteobacteria bacterium]
MNLIGITGTIGSGKTTIADKLRSLGLVVFDIDGWVKRLYNRKNFLNIIKKEFPNTFKDGVFNKRELRNTVFNNKKELEKLEEIIHPILNTALKRKIKKISKFDDIFFIDTPLLFEMEWDKYCHHIILADVDYEVAKVRVMKRDNISAEDFEKIYDKQIKNIDKEHLADIIVNTDMPKNVLKAKLIKVLEKL